MFRAAKYCLCIQIVAFSFLNLNTVAAIEIPPSDLPNQASVVNNDFSSGTDPNQIANAQHLLCSGMNMNTMDQCDQIINENPVVAPSENNNVVAVGGSSGGSSGGSAPVVDSGGWTGIVTNSSGGGSGVSGTTSAPANNTNVETIAKTEVAPATSSTTSNNTKSASSPTLKFSQEDFGPIVLAPTPSKQVEVVRTSAVAATPVNKTKANRQMVISSEEKETAHEIIVQPVDNSLWQSAFANTMDWQASAAKWATSGNKALAFTLKTNSELLTYLGVLVILTQCLLFNFWIAKQLLKVGETVITRKRSDR